jgi:NADH-quinone oxidoreductase subunit I
MYGLGILKGLAITFKHFIETYTDDFRLGKKRYNTPEGIAYRSSADMRGAFTIQYPEEKLPVPEQFRFLPFLIYEEGENGEKNMRCTSCGICAKACPPQCIYITRTVDPVTNKPVPTPAEYYIDIDLCMNCGFCAEYCPFDAIRMDHEYEIASYNRKSQHIYDLTKLAKPVSYYASIRPTQYQAEEAEKAAKAAAKAAASTAA